jgi:membrane fusion protein
MSQDLFRPEVVPSDHRLRLGHVLLIPPLPSRVLFSLAGAAIVSLALLACFGTYTRHVALQGVISPRHGVVKLYAPQVGRLQLLKVKEGDPVARGEVLMVFDTERQSSQGVSVDKEVDLRLAEKLQKLRTDLESTRKLQQAELTGLHLALESQRHVRDGLQHQIALLQQRGSSADITVRRFDDLRKSGYVTEQAAQDKHDEQVEQQVRLQSAQHDLTTSLQEIDRLTVELSAAPERQQVALDQIEREISGTQSDIAVQQTGHEWALTSPCDCQVSSVDIGSGQTAEPNYPLISLIPRDAALQATLYATSRSLGFIAVDQVVELKLDAFPFEKFGAVDGHVESISSTPLTTTENSVGTHLGLPQSDGPQEPMYSVKVRLDRSAIDAYCHPQPLRSGMQLNAAVQLETRRLYEWMLLPLLESGRR